LNRMALIDVGTEDELKKLIEEHRGCLFTLHFWASWAKQCEQMNDVLGELAKDSKLVHVKFIKVEAEELPDLCETYEVEAVPTFVLLKNGKVIDRVQGANAPELTKKIRLHSERELALPPSTPGSCGDTPAQTDPKLSLDDRLRALVKRDPVLLFMKGSPAEPRCGFSKQVIKILEEQNVIFGHFDILKDDEVRQGLKTFSNWPTYPQLYVNGSLLGGLDVIKELIEEEEFLDQLPEEAKRKPQLSLDDRLKALVNKEAVMIFMKGVPENPRCGFSKQLVAILSAEAPDVAYGHFDILSDEEVRQGLKTFSNWPTYPQIYVKGELVGGLDILKELQEAGELKDTLMGN